MEEILLPALVVVAILALLMTMGQAHRLEHESVILMRASGYAVKGSFEFRRMMLTMSAESAEEMLVYRDKLIEFGKGAHFEESKKFEQITRARAGSRHENLAPQIKSYIETALLNLEEDDVYSIRARHKI